jgi:peptide-methionine (S)-S-oxide reductase
MQTCVLGGGCFWCLEAAYQEIAGVVSAVPGYAGGSTTNPTYQAVSGGATGHAEVVRVTFDPAVIGYSDILDIFWAIHNPTTPNQQGNDVGSQYRSIILTETDEQAKIAEASRHKVQALWPNPVVTEIKPLGTFYEAEAYHHNYFVNNPQQAYCTIVINPKLQKLRQVFKARLKPAK